ncbi:MAG: PAS domain S-box protein [Cyanobacteria bacterium SID2]|nr:PAS domain S-box protein [Cyanobacteria bacterium SID2]
MNTDRVREIGDRTEAPPSVSDDAMRYLAILDTQPDYICRFTADCTLTFVNLAYCRYFGKSREELIGKNFRELIPDRDRVAIDRMLQAIDSDNPIYTHEHQVIDANNTVRWLQWSNQGIFDRHNQLLEYQAVGRDITDRKSVEKQLYASENYLRSVVVEMPGVAVYTLDLDGRIVSWNAGATAVYGYHEPEILDRSLSQLFADPALASQLLQQARRAEKGEVESWQVCEDSSRFWAQSLLKCLDDELGNLRGFIHIVIDRSTERQAELTQQQLTASLARSERLLRTTIDLVPHAIFAKDLDGRYILANQATAEIFGISVERLLGKWDIEIAQFREIAEEFRREDLQVLEQGGTKQVFRNEIVSADGQQLIFETTKLPLNLDGKISGILGIAIDITQRQQVLQALRESEERFRQMAENVSDVFFLYSPDLHEAIYVSPNCQAIWGYSPKDFYERPDLWLDRVYEDDRAAVVAQLQVVSQREVVAEYRVVRPDDSLRWLRSRTFPVRDSQGRTYRIVGIIEDITERQIANVALNQAYEALRDREARYRTLTNHAPVGIFQTDERGSIDFVNQRWCEITGIPLVAAYRECWQSAVHPDDRSMFFDCWERARTDIISWEGRIVSPGGRVAWVLARSAPLRDRHGQSCGTVGTLLDITARKQTEAQLQQLSGALEQSADNVIITDRQGTIVYVNAEFERLTGYTKDEAIGRQPSLLKSGIHDAAFYQGLWSIITSGHVFHAVFTNRKKSGELFHEQKTISPLRDEGGHITHFISTGKDVTERQRAEARLERINQCFLDFGNDPTDNVRRLAALCGELLEPSRVSYRRWQQEQLQPTCQWFASPETGRVKEGNAAVAALLAGREEWFEREIEGDRTEWGKVVRSQNREIGVLCLVYRGAFAPCADDRRVLGIITSAIAVEEDQYRVQEALRRQMERERAVSTIARHIHCSLELPEILKTAVDEIRHFLQCDRVAVCQFEADWQGKIVAQSWSASCEKLQRWLFKAGSQRPYLLRFDKACLQAYSQGEIQLMSQTKHCSIEHSNCPAFREFNVCAQIAVPILQGEQLWGLLLVQQYHESRQWETSDVEFVRQLATQLGIATQQSQLYQQLRAANDELKRLASIDGLTQVANRRQFDEFFRQAWHRSKTQQTSLALVLCDIDFFKAYNDTYGHQAGDDCLKRVAQSIESAVSGTQTLVARYGGEEFAVVMLETDAEATMAIVAAVNRAVIGLEIPHSRSLASSWVTVSLGGASIVPEDGSTPEMLLRRADLALYRAKQNGRNRYYLQREDN